MRKQLVIGLSLLMLMGVGGTSDGFTAIKDSIFQNSFPETIKYNNFDAGRQISSPTVNLSLPQRSNYQTASVFFVTGKKKLNFGNMEFNDQTVDQCKNLGYTKTSCNTGFRLAESCPYNAIYYKTCCLNSYKYLANECTPPRTISSTACGGKYKCSCSTTTYPYTSSNCKSLKVLGGETCSIDGVTRYSQCSCPSSYSQTCTGLNQKGEGTGCTENGVTKYKSCTCNTGYILTCSDLGPVTPNDYCLKNNIKYYKSCKTCANECTLTACPTGVSCTQEACSQKFCDSGTCLSGYTNWCTKPTTDCAALGYTMTSTECSGAMVMKCPFDTSKLFCIKTQDESSQKTKACDSVGDILYAAGNCAFDIDKPDLSLKPVGVVFDVSNRLAVALTDIKKDGSPGYESMTWSTASCDTPNLANCGEAELETCDTNGGRNTSALRVSSCNGTIYPIQAINAYTPSNCTNSFCKQGQWFLPSAKEWFTIYDSLTVLNYSLSLIQGEGIVYDWGYWSSTELDSRTMWKIYMDYPTTGMGTKTVSTGVVRPIVKY